MLKTQSNSTRRHSIHKNSIDLLGQDGKSIMHTELKMGDSWIMLSEEAPQMNCKSPQSLGGTGIYYTCTSMT